MDSTPHDTAYFLQEDLKPHLVDQESWDKFYPILVSDCRKIQEQVWNKIVLKLSNDNGIELKVVREDDDSIIIAPDKPISDADPYVLGGECNASS